MWGPNLWRAEMDLAPSGLHEESTAVPLSFTGLRYVPPLWPLWSLGSCTPITCGRCTQYYWDGRGSISIHKQQFGSWEWLVPSVFILGEGGSLICMSLSGTQDVWQRRKSFLSLKSYWEDILKLVLLLLLFCYSQIPVCLFLTFIVVWGNWAHFDILWPINVITVWVVALTGPMLSFGNCVRVGFPTQW